MGSGNVNRRALIVAPTLPMTKDILANYYTKDGDNFTPNFDAIAKISTAGEK